MSSVQSRKSEERENVLSQRRTLPIRDEDLLLQCALFDVHRVSRSLTVRYNAYLRESGMTMAQFTLLRNIAALAPAGMKQIAEAMLMDRTSVTRLIEPLIKEGLLTTAAGADRRYRNVQVTAAGMSAIARSEKAWRRAQQEFFECIGPAQWRELRTALRNTLHLIRDDVQI